jgi:hypothetical protein
MENVDTTVVFEMNKDELMTRLRRLHLEYLSALSKKNTSSLATLQSHVITMAHKIAVLNARR